MAALSTYSAKLPPAVENLLNVLVFVLAGIVATRTGLNDLVKAYLWDPPGGLYTIICLVVVETIATAFLLVRVDYRALAIRLAKFIGGYCLIFLIVHWLNKYDATTLWMRPIVTNGSAALHFVFLAKALARLGFMRPEVAVQIGKRAAVEQQIETPEIDPSALPAAPNE